MKIFNILLTVFLVPINCYADFREYYTVSPRSYILGSISCDKDIEDLKKQIETLKINLTSCVESTKKELKNP